MLRPTSLAVLCPSIFLFSVLLSLFSILLSLSCLLFPSFLCSLSRLFLPIHYRVPAKSARQYAHPPSFSHPGRGTGVVIATGEDTEFGLIFSMMQDVRLSLLLVVFFYTAWC